MVKLKFGCVAILLEGKGKVEEVWKCFYHIIVMESVGSVNIISQWWKTKVFCKVWSGKNSESMEMLQH